MPPKNTEEKKGQVKDKEKDTPEVSEKDVPGVSAVIAGLQDQINNLQHQLKTGIPLEEVKRVEEYTAKVMFYNGDPVVRFGKIGKVDKNGEERMTIVITTKSKDGKEKDHTVDYLETFNESDRVACTILNLKKEPLSKKQGTNPQQARIMAMKSDPAGAISGTRDFSRKPVTLQETFDVIGAKVKITEGEWEGEELDLESGALNP